MGLRLPGLRVRLPPSEPFVRNDQFADNNERMEVSLAMLPCFFENRGITDDQ